jgi:hypothetical protein
MWFGIRERSFDGPQAGAVGRAAGGGRLVLLVVDGHFQGQETAEALGGDHFIAAGAFGDCRQVMAGQFVTGADLCPGLESPPV